MVDQYHFEVFTFVLKLGIYDPNVGRTLRGPRTRSLPAKSTRALALGPAPPQAAPGELGQCHFGQGVSEPVTGGELPRGGLT